MPSGDDAAATGPMLLFDVVVAGPMLLFDVVAAWTMLLFYVVAAGTMLLFDPFSLFLLMISFLILILHL